MKEKAFVGDGGVVWSENSLEEKYSFFFFFDWWDEWLYSDWRRQDVQGPVV